MIWWSRVMLRAHKNKYNRHTCLCAIYIMINKKLGCWGLCFAGQKGLIHPLARQTSNQLQTYKQQKYLLGSRPAAKISFGAADEQSIANRQGAKYCISTEASASMQSLRIRLNIVLSMMLLNIMIQHHAHMQNIPR